MKKIVFLISFIAIYSAVNSQVHTLKESIYFGIGKSSLSAAHKSKLDSVIILLKASKKYEGEIKGYTCNIGSTSLNKLISNLRALNVYNYLVDRGANRKSFTYTGLGNANPAESNSTAQGRAANRRTDIEVLLSLMDESATTEKPIVEPVKAPTKVKTKQPVLEEEVIKIKEQTTNGKKYAESTIRTYTGKVLKADNTVTDYNGSSSSTTTSYNSTSNSSNSSSSSTSNSNTSSSSNSTTESNSSYTKGAVKDYAKKPVTTTEAIKTPAVAVKTIEIGPEFSSGKFPMEGNKSISSTNGVKINLDRNTFVTSSKEPIELDYKDYTFNFDIIKKGLQTKSNGQEMKLLGAFNVNFTQDYQEVSINASNPVIISIPADYDPDIKLYSNHRNWQLDTLNKFSYNEDKHVYEVKVINNNQMIGLLKPIETQALKYLKVKIKGVSPDLIKPYVIYDNCMISQGIRLKGKWFIFPITQTSETYRLRAQYIDYSTKSPEFNSLDFDVKNLQPVGNPSQINSGETITLQLPSKVFFKKEKLMQSSLCEMPAEAK